MALFTTFFILIYDVHMDLNRTLGACNYTNASTEAPTVLLKELNMHPNVPECITCKHGIIPTRCEQLC